ncbi:MAG: S9 family peptidase [Calditrichaceae bacterium]|nr:S9 family peptidase [Calditrichaceae bacterium]
MRIILIFLLTLPFLAGAAEKKPFTIEDLYRIKSVSDPQISPDGSRIVYVVTEYDMHRGRSNSDLYIMDADGKKQRRLTCSEAADYHPRWSADGRNILFVSGRENSAQAWSLPMAGGEPKQLTNFPSGISEPEWIGSSKKIVFIANIFPECGADRECNETTQSSMDNGPLQAHMADRLLYRHWNFYKDSRRDHILMYDPDLDKYTDLTSGDFDAPALWGSFSISADGRYLCYESNHDTVEAETTDKDIFLVDLESLEAVNLTEKNMAYDGSPVFSPDGKYIAYQSQQVPGFESDFIRLTLYDIEKQTSKILTDESFDYWSSDYQWSADGGQIFFITQERGYYPLYQYELKSEKISKVLDLKTINNYQIDPSARWVVISRTSINQPVELFRAPVKGAFDKKKATRLTFYNARIEEEVDIRPAEELWIDSPTGAKIHTFLVKPHDFDPAKKYPLILNVHGGPQYQWADAFRGDWQVYPGSGYIVAFPNPHGSTGYGQEFTNAISRDWGGKVYDDIMAVTEYLSKLEYVDESRIGAMGWSYGGYMMMWLEGHTGRFKALAAMMGLYNLSAFYGSTEELWFPEYDLGGPPWENPDIYKKFSPDQYVKNFKTPCLVITGEKDYRVPYTQSLEFFTALQKMNVPSRLIIFKNDGHWPDNVKSMPFYYNAHLDWFYQYLGGKPAPYDMNKMLKNQVFEER